MAAQQLTYRTTKLAEGSLRASRHILHLDATCGTTASTAISAATTALLDELARLKPDMKVERLNLWDKDMQSRTNYQASHEKSKAALLQGSGSEEDSAQFRALESLTAQVSTSRGLIVSSPAWNFGAPWVLKQYFDCILQPGLTYHESNGTCSPLLGRGRTMIFVTSASSSKDHFTPWLRDVAAMIGFDDAIVLPLHASAPAASNADDAASAAKRLALSIDALEDGNASGDAKMREKPDLVEAGWPFEQLCQWLRIQGGVSEDALESLMAMKVNGNLWFQTTEDDWRNEELGLEDEDVARLLELQSQQKQLLEELAERDPEAAAAIVEDKNDD